MPPVSREEILYAEVDGSMILTKEEQWREVKLGRIFKSSDCLNPNTDNCLITQSHYVSHLGSSREFGDKMDESLDAYGRLRQQLVFITDGATWIKNWIDDTYPDSISILDFYHACQHLYDFAKNCFKEENEIKQWVLVQKTCLLESKVEQVISNIESITETKDAHKQKLINYLTINKERMRYKEYRQTGCGIIGSGAIESAHRTVIQKRMKLSGQHWSIHGAKNMLKLRTLYMNQQWCKVIDIVNSKSKLAA